jgi:hypothetical protein
MYKSIAIYAKPYFCAFLVIFKMVGISRLWVASTLLVEHAFASRNVVEGNATHTYTSDLLHESMDWLDMFYDNERGYLFSLNAAALTHETRASVWYAAGLLARNQADDVEQAVRIVKNVIGMQFSDERQQW